MVLARRLSGRSPTSVSARNFSSPLMHARRLSPRSFTSISLRHFSSPLTHEVDDEVNGFDSFNKKFNSVDEEVHDANEGYKRCVEIKDIGDNSGRGVVAARARGDAVILL